VREREPWGRWVIPAQRVETLSRASPCVAVAELTMNTAVEEKQNQLARWRTRCCPITRRLHKRAQNSSCATLQARMQVQHLLTSCLASTPRRKAESRRGACCGSLTTRGGGAPAGLAAQDRAPRLKRLRVVLVQLVGAREHDAVVRQAHLRARRQGGLVQHVLRAARRAGVSARALPASPPRALHRLRPCGPAKCGAQALVALIIND